MPNLRPAKRTLPAYDPENNIGAVDRIRMAMMNGMMEQLTDAEHVQFNRWKQVDDWIRDKRLPGDRELRNMIIAKYGVAWDTAQRDIRNAKQLFCATEDNHEYYRSVYIEQTEAAAKKAERDGDFRAFEKLMRLAAEMRGIDTAKKEEIPYEKLQTFNFIIQFNPESAGFKTLENKEEVLAKYQRKKRISQKMAEQAEDAELDL